MKLIINNNKISNKSDIYIYIYINDFIKILTLALYNVTLKDVGCCSTILNSTSRGRYPFAYTYNIISLNHIKLTRIDWNTCII